MQHEPFAQTVATQGIHGGRGPLLASKITVPGLPDGLVERPRLGRLLDAGTRGPVTLLSAPAGSGKTVLLSWWLRTRAPAGPVAWLTVERGDTGDRFWAYLHAALDASGAGLPAPWPGGGPDEVYPTELADALAHLREPVVVVLDDFHECGDPRLAHGLEFLLRHAPAQLRLVVATRTDPPFPLHRWRLSGELTELRAEELSFTEGETADLLMRHGLVLPDVDAGALHDRAEGWAAGLRMAALSLRGRLDPAGFVEQFGGDLRSIADYLFNEVLAGLPGEIWDFLLHTSVLARVSADLAEAVTGRADSADILAGLEKANAFVVSLGGRRPWYRYHRLFGELLRAELRRRTPDLIPELHRRAATWQAAHGMPGEALRHALAAADWRYATDLLERRWQDLVLCRASESPRVAVPALPEDRLAAEPELALAYAADCLDARDLDGAEQYLRLADVPGQALGDGRAGRFALMSAAFHLAGSHQAGDLAGVLSGSAQMLSLSAGADDRPRAIALIARGEAELVAGELTEAAEALGAGLAAAERTGLTCPQLLGASNLALLRALRGDLHDADKTAREALELPAGPSRCRLDHSAPAYLALAVVQYQWDRLTDAGRYLDLAARAGDDGGAGPALTAYTALVRAWLLLARGELIAGYEALRAGRRELGDRPPSRSLEHWLTAAEADLRTAYGDTGTARDLLEPLLHEAGGAPEPVAVALARAYLRDDDPAAATRILPHWADAQPARSPLAVRLEAGLVEALAARRMGDQRRSRRILEHVLGMAGPDGFRRPFTHGGPLMRDVLVDHLNSGTAHWPLLLELIEAAEHQPPPQRDPSGFPSQPLTDRELTVLRYLQSMLSNVEIAGELFLSVNTVKTHVRNIYRKFDVATRRDAVRRARELRLL